MTTEQANQLSTLYNQLIKYEGDKVLLWTNSSPTSSFAPQTITISGGFSSYRYLILECYGNIDSNFHSDTNTNTEYILRSTSDTETFSVSAAGNLSRAATISKTNGTVVFGPASTGTGSTNHSVCIPAKIYGI